MVGELARADYRRTAARDRRVEQEDGENRRDRERDDETRWASSTSHPAILVRSPRDDSRFPGWLLAVDGGQGLGQRRLAAGFLDHRIHHCRHDPGGDLLDSRATLLRKPGKLLTRTPELVLEDFLRMGVECAVATTHRQPQQSLGQVRIRAPAGGPVRAT